MILEVKNDMLTGKGTENALHLELIKKDIDLLNKKSIEAEVASHIIPGSQCADMGH